MRLSSNLAIVLLALLPVALGCKSEAQQVADQEALVRKAEENLKREAALKEAALKRQIRSTPGAFLEATDLGAFDKGVLNSYRQLTKVTVKNKTRYALDGIKGEVEWLDDQGVVREKTLVRLKRSIPAGDTKVFSTGDGSMDSGTTESHAHKYVLKFTSASVIESPE